MKDGPAQCDHGPAVRPTGRAVLLCLAFLSVSWASLVFAPGAWQAILYLNAAVLLVMGLDGLFMLPRHLVSASVLVPEQILLGDELRVRFAIATPSHRAAASVTVEVEVAADGVRRTLVATRAIALHGATSVEVGWYPRKRGIYATGNASVTWKSRLGLVSQTLHVPGAHSTTVIPNVHKARSAAIDYFTRNALLGMKTQLFRGQGTEFEALRPHTAGMDSRFIDWKHSARHMTLVCKEFRAERNHPIVFAFDTGYLMQAQVEGLPRLDHAISSAMILAWIAVKSGDLVGSFAFDEVVRHFAVPARGSQAYLSMQQATARLPYTQCESRLTMALTELELRLKRRSLVILLTEFVDTISAELMMDHMRQFARRHVVVFACCRDPGVGQEADKSPDTWDQLARSVLAYELSASRAVVLERLGRMGVHCIDTDARSLPLSLLNRYLYIKSRWLM